MKRGKAVWVIVLLVSATLAGMKVFPVFFDRPLTSGKSQALSSLRVVQIPEGATFRQVATLLEKEQVIRSRWVFLALGKLDGTQRRILAGEYAFHAGMKPSDILSELRQGHVVLHPITIPEGYTLAQIAALFEQRGLGQARELDRLAHDPEFIRSLGLDVASLEGYLAPDTYRFARNVSAKEILTSMVEGTRKVFTSDLITRAAELHMSVHEVLTLASVVEKETGAGRERDFVSSVFHNRLKRRIPLQSDPTVIYGLKRFDGNLRKRDLLEPSPYNTYRRAGLPPGPIANPGAQAIRASLFPAPTKYLYFVSRNDGTHQFSSTLAEHERAVDHYQRKRQGRRLP